MRKYDGIFQCSQVKMGRGAGSSILEVADVRLPAKADEAEARAPGRA